MKPYEFLPHTADIRIVANGKTLEEAFTNAAYAVTDVVVDQAEVKKIVEKKIEIESENQEALFYDFIENFLFLIDAEGFLLGEITEIKIEGNKVIAKLLGDEHASKYESKTHVKAMTYQELEIKETEEGFRIHFIVDI